MVAYQLQQFIKGLKSATLDGQIGICMQDNLASNWFSKIEEIASQGLSYRKNNRR